MMKIEVPRFCDKKVFDPRNQDSTVLFDELIGHLFLEILFKLTL